jgi:hypothetical protein
VNPRLRLIVEGAVEARNVKIDLHKRSRAAACCSTRLWSSPVQSEPSNSPRISPKRIRRENHVDN